MESDRPDSPSRPEPAGVGEPHWESIYRQRGADRVSWYQPHAETSLRLIHRTALPRSAPVIDVGGGASTLADDLLRAGHTDITVLDLSAQALALAQARLGADAGRVRWLAADLTRAELPAQGFALWHDRAVFHFLAREEERQRYRAALHHALRDGGFVVIATFAEDGPTACSGLPVVRYGADALCAALGPGLVRRHAEREVHVTPAGAPQPFTWCVLQRGTDA